MRFEVSYIPFAVNWSIGGSPKKNINFQGEGSVLLQDVALVFQGNIPKFELGCLLGLFTFLYEQVLYVKTTRTVPYSAILKYIKPRGEHNTTHQINYRFPNGEQRILKFDIIRFHRLQARNDEEFACKLEEYINSAKSFIDS